MKSNINKQIERILLSEECCPCYSNEDGFIGSYELDDEYVKIFTKKIQSLLISTLKGLKGKEIWIEHPDLRYKGKICDACTTDRIYNDATQQHNKKIDDKLKEVE